MAESQIQNQNQNQNQNPFDSDQFSEMTDKFDKILTLQSSSTTSRQIDDEEQQEADNGDENLSLQPSTSTTHQINEDEGEDEDEEEDEQNEEFEFCFFGEAVKSPVSAEEVFEDGQIRIISPFPGEISDAGEGESSYGSQMKKLFVVSNSPEKDDVAEGPYCVWNSSTPEMSKKSNSTGFSKLWKVRDLLSRSNSDGKDAFVFLKNDDTTSVKKEKKSKVKLENIEVGKRGETTTYVKKENSKKKKKSAYEVFYGDNKKKGSSGKSYLPYRQDLVGFFTNGSGMSRNVHPY